MAITWEYVQVEGDNITPSRLIWRRYRRPAPGMIEVMMDANGHLADALQHTAFLPVGAIVAVPIDSDIMSGRPRHRPTVFLYGKEKR